MNIHGWEISEETAELIKNSPGCTAEELIEIINRWFTVDEKLHNNTSK